MILRPARSEDAASISNLAGSLKLEPRLSTRNGFLVYPLNESGYQARTSSPFFYVAETDSNLDGFLMCYDSVTLDDFLEKGLLDHEEGLVQYITKQQTPYIFGDQIGVRKGKNRHNVGTAMMDKLFQDMQQKKIPTMYVGILHQPVRNYASIDFCTKLGFTKISEVANKDETVWGVYQLNLN